MHSFTKYFCVASVLLLIISCNNSTDINIGSGRSIDSLERVVIRRGDTQAYNILRKEFLESRQFEAIGFSLIMANKYKYVPACHDFATSYLEWYQINQDNDSLDLTNMDKDSRKLVLKYLFLACKSKDSADSMRLQMLKAPYSFEDDFIEARRQAEAWD